MLPGTFGLAGYVDGSTRSATFSEASGGGVGPRPAVDGPPLPENDSYIFGSREAPRVNLTLAMQSRPWPCW